MAETLYDLLEVSQAASSEAIQSAYARLKSALSIAAIDEEDKINRLKALKEAHTTLSDPKARARYDDRLAVRLATPAVYVEKESPIAKILMLGAVIAVCGFGYVKYDAAKEKARFERERLVSEEKKAELAAQKEEEEKSAQQARNLAAEQRSKEAADRAELERSRAYANQVSKGISAQETQARREQDRQQQQQLASSERQQQLEAERRASKDKALLRQLQYENSGGGRYKY